MINIWLQWVEGKSLTVYLLNGDNQDKDHSCYSVARVIGVANHVNLSRMFAIIAWLVIPVMKSLDRSLLATAMGASACQNWWWECFYLSMRPEVGAGIVSSMHMARSDSQSPVWYMCAHLRDILWPKVVLCSVTFWCQPRACNFSTFSTCTPSGSPHPYHAFI